MDQPQEPDWSLLPHSAMDFFELEASFDRKDLKRAYNRLIRVYKPEKHSAEFQKIRAAFEQLENQLRFGQSYTSFFSAVPETTSWDASSSATGEAASNQQEPTTSDGVPSYPAEPASLLERLKTESVTAVYKDLSKRTNKTPRQYFELAVLSDIVVPEQELYAKWLLTGLQKVGSDPGLFALIRTYLSLDHPAPLLARLLPTVAKVVADDRFYFVTEPAWMRLLNEGGFDVFRKTLAACEKKLKDHRQGSKLAFYARILKAAMWSADDAWLKSRLRWVESNADSGSQSLDYDLLVLESLEQYHQVVDDLSDSNPVIAMMDEAIRGYFTLGEREADARFVQCQYWLVENSQALLSSFPSREYDERVEPLILLWMTLHEDVSQRHGVEIRGTNRTRKEQLGMFKRTVAMSRELHRQWRLGTVDNIVVLLLQWPATVMAFVLPVLLCLVVVGLFTNLIGLPIGYLSLLLTLLSFMAGIATSWFLIRPALQRSTAAWVTRRVKSGYSSVWRSQLLAFFDATGITSGEVSDILEQCDDDAQAGNLRLWIARLLNADFGLLIYSVANRYRR